MSGTPRASATTEAAVELLNSFTVPAGIDRAWDTLMDIERVAPCMPGATLTSVDGDDVTGSVKVKLGPVTVTYKGKGTFLERDAAAHVAVIEGSGNEARGSGTAQATAHVSLHAESPESTRVDVTTDLVITGKVAQFGRGVVQDVAARLVDKFAANLAALMTGPEPEPEPEPEPSGPGEPTPAARRPEEPARPAPELPHQDEAIDLFDTAGAPVLKRAAPILAGVAVVAFLWWLLTRRGRR
ncbi:MAG TPA: SRPBCC family protein [Candidatus Nanopelagicales bacterium]